MRLAKILVIAAIIASGYGIGYLCHPQQTGSPAQPSSALPAAVAGNEALPPGYDPSLILPPPSTKGEILDQTFDAVKKYYGRPKSLLDDAAEKPTSGIISSYGTVMSTPPATMPPPMAAVPAPDETPIPAPAPLPAPIVRLPAPPDEPAPAARRVEHREPAAWLYVNRRDIQLNFDITKAGPSGVKAVELWGRHSSDNDFECIDRMDGGKGPFSTRLWSEGVYEFRLVLISGTGMRSAIPGRNDQPDLWVCLDTSAPVVEMLPLRPDPEQMGAIQICWHAFDKHLDDNPIRLEYSLEGRTWLPIADEWLPNTGVYSWKVPDNLPSELHLRVRARDKAGNIGESRSPSKTPVDLTAPEARITGIVETLPAPKEEEAKAPFQVDHLTLCRGVRTFRDFNAYEPGHAFHAGDLLTLYAELRNFTCEPTEMLKRRQDGLLTPDQGLSIHLTSTLEIRDAQNQAIWHVDLVKDDFPQKSPHDYYHAYRFFIPDKLPSGDYSLWLHVTDKPTGDVVHKSLELRIGERLPVSPDAQEVLPAPGAEIVQPVPCGPDIGLDGHDKLQPSPNGKEIASVKVIGNRFRPEEQITALMNLKPGRRYTPEIAADDVGRLIAKGWFASQGVTISTQDLPDGRITVVVSVRELPKTIRRVIYKGAEHLGKEECERLTELEPGNPMNPASNQNARNALIRAYHEKGRCFADVKLVKGNRESDDEVIFEICEGPPVHVRRVEFKFVGPAPCGDAKELQRGEVKSRVYCNKTGLIFNRFELDTEMEKLRECYRREGYRNARVLRELVWSVDCAVTIVLHIEEGNCGPKARITSLGGLQQVVAQEDDSAVADAPEWFDWPELFAAPRPSLTARSATNEWWRFPDKSEANKIIAIRSSRDSDPGFDFSKPLTFLTPEQDAFLEMIRPDHVCIGDMELEFPGFHYEF